MKKRTMRVVDDDPNEATADDITEMAYPEGVPKSDDGNVMREADISVEDARRIGAITADDALYNRTTNKIINAKLSGKTNVAWGTTDAITLFDEIKKAWPPNAIRIHIDQIEPTFKKEFMPAMSQFTDSADFFDYLYYKVYNGIGNVVYKVIYRHNGNSQVGSGRVHISPNVGDERGLKPPQPPQSSYAPQQLPPPVYGYPPPPQSPSPQQQARGGQAAPAPLEVPHGASPELLAVMRETSELKQIIMQNQLQIAEAIGAINEVRRAAGAPAMPSPLPQVAAVPLAAPSLVPVVPPPRLDPMSQALEATRVLSEMRKAVRAAQAEFGEDPSHHAEPLEASAPAPAPGMTRIPLGAGEGAPGVMLNEDGGVNFGATLLGALPLLMTGAKSFMEMMTRQQEMQAEQLRIARSMGSPPMLGMPPPPPPSAYMQDPPPQSAAPIPPPPVPATARNSLIPGHLTPAPAPAPAPGFSLIPGLPNR